MCLWSRQQRVTPQKVGFAVHSELSTEKGLVPLICDNETSEECVISEDSLANCVAILQDSTHKSWKYLLFLVVFTCECLIKIRLGSEWVIFHSWLTSSYFSSFLNKFPTWINIFIIIIIIKKRREEIHKQSEFRSLKKQVIRNVWVIIKFNCFAWVSLHVYCLKVEEMLVISHSPMKTVFACLGSGLLENSISFKPIINSSGSSSRRFHLLAIYWAHILKSSAFRTGFSLISGQWLILRKNSYNLIEWKRDEDT